MIPVDQTVFVVPGGNCFSACIASLLDLPLEDVPYFMGDFNDNEDWFPRLLDWLRPRGWWALPVPLNNEWRPSGLCILSGKSPRGDFDHSVVAMGHGCGEAIEVVHDPHPSRDGVNSLMDVVVLVPLDPKSQDVLALVAEVRRLRAVMEKQALVLECMEPCWASQEHDQACGSSNDGKQVAKAIRAELDKDEAGHA